MTISRDVVLAYEGEEYTFTPSFNVLRKIEAGLAPSSLTSVVARVSAGNPPLFDLAYILTQFLRTAGAAVKEDQIYTDLCAAFSDDPETFLKLYAQIVRVISPSEGVAKKSLGIGGSGAE